MVGDANCDNIVNLSDAIIIMQALTNPSKYGVGGTSDGCLTEQGKANADCCNTGDGMSNKDALAIQRFLLGLIPSLPANE